jgi:hypothetical protein
MRPIPEVFPLLGMTTYDSGFTRHNPTKSAPETTSAEPPVSSGSVAANTKTTKRRTIKALLACSFMQRTVNLPKLPVE